MEAQRFRIGHLSSDGLRNGVWAWVSLLLCACAAEGEEGAAQAFLKRREGECSAAGTTAASEQPPCYRIVSSREARDPLEYWDEDDNPQGLYRIYYEMWTREAWKGRLLLRAICRWDLQYVHPKFSAKEQLEMPRRFPFSCDFSQLEERRHPDACDAMRVRRQAGIARRAADVLIEDPERTAAELQRWGQCVQAGECTLTAARTFLDAQFKSMNSLSPNDLGW